jgi:hypothetical protein
MWVHRAISTAGGPEKVRLATENRTPLNRKSGDSLAPDRALGRRGAALLSRVNRATAYSPTISCRATTPGVARRFTFPVQYRAIPEQDRIFRSNPDQSTH